ncbi:hypothetical protein JOB18_046245 [Solea senegalensis]|uniref:Uncharacterized protein n=1 Tax=Solea senegalensis TaxID=28829 RepID=A0AAV6SJ88_SOLSE|nr:hypothetical protein JOB18_046245 [Solea senegalensis]
MFVQEIHLWKPPKALFYFPTHPHHTCTSVSKSFRSLHCVSHIVNIPPSHRFSSGLFPTEVPENFYSLVFWSRFYGGSKSLLCPSQHVVLSPRVSSLLSPGHESKHPELEPIQ